MSQESDQSKLSGNLNLSECNDIKDKELIVEILDIFDKLTLKGKLVLNYHIVQSVTNELKQSIQTAVDLAYVTICDDGKIAEEDLEAANILEKVETYLSFKMT